MTKPNSLQKVQKIGFSLFVTFITGLLRIIEKPIEKQALYLLKSTYSYTYVQFLQYEYFLNI